MTEYGIPFSNRAEAGQQLGKRLAALHLDTPLIYALPRGGVPVAVEIGRALGAPVDLILVRKIGAPGNPEVALGAVVEGTPPDMVLNDDVWRVSGADDAYLETARASALAELQRRRDRYLGDRPRHDPKGRTVIVVDDGLATGATMKAALRFLKRRGAARIVVALPVAPLQTLDEMSELADDVICLHPAHSFRGVGGYYRDFHQLSDDETVALLDEAAQRYTQTTAAPAPRDPVQMARRQVHIPPLGLIGDLAMPRDPIGLVLFAHGSGSSRLSPRNAQVATAFNEAGFATLLFDLLTPEEAKDRRNVFDIPLLATRVVEACMWAASEPDTDDLPVGLFGASTGAAAALVAAAQLKDRVSAVVSRGGRPDLAGPLLPEVTAPSLLIVGSRDTEVLHLNEAALAEMTCTKSLQLIPGATHLFEEPGTLDAVIQHAVDWFDAHVIVREPIKPTPPIPTKSPQIKSLRAAAEPLPPLNDPAFAEAFDRFGSHRVVLLGEATHGTSEFYRARAAITRRLIEQHGFSIVAVEADWPDAAAIDRHIRHRPQDAMRNPPFARFPTWMWRNEEFQGFADALRQHNASVDPGAHVRFYGLDLYNMRASIEAVLAYLDRADPAAAEIARARYACLLPWASDPAAYGRAALSHGFATCETAVAQMLTELLERDLHDALHNGDAAFDATQNARLVANAERYYRAMYYGSRLSWNLRDRHMFETLDAILDRAGPDGKAVVWAHNSHIGDARFTDMGRQRGELNLGQLCHQAYGDSAALIGFGTASGTVAAASDWDGPMEIKTLRAPRADSVEHLCHQLDLERFLFDLRPEQSPRQTPDLYDILSRDRLERYVGVIYRPETERASHYSATNLAKQYDGFVWFDSTNAITPLPTLSKDVEDETYPFGL